ncbi:glycoside hydrolase family 2 [candidate division KSB3 bacterium]|uniref:Glycoside hydrolase family 2 n=1 Tax=candidate division KSB3 bacterium TaxID=2044937 RepID=A0A2G6K6M9_9BACT|nr:MAG: glycoside hydrolase family 2 [candidate division KSB3 bacterium]
MSNTEHRAENQLEEIHNEAYAARYNLQNLSHAGMIATAGRRREQLNGQWRFMIDPYDTGLRMGWHEYHWREIAEQDLPWDYESDGGDAVNVPSCWNFLKPEYFYYEGSTWYAREFGYMPDEPDERVFLRIGAANYTSMIFLNQEFLGSHAGGSTPFFVELTGKLQEHNLLQVCVNNDRSIKHVPMRNTDWFNYGGLYRDVELFRLPKDFIKTFEISLVPNDSFSELAVSIEVSDPNAQDEVFIRIPELNIETTFVLENGKIEAILKVQPELWSPENPKLYDVAVMFRNDLLTDRIGFRQIRVEGTTILLNGKPIFLRGICAHEDDVELGKTSDRDDILRRFKHAKELGCNFMRLAHYPHHELAAQLADEVGLLLWEEIPVYWAIAFDDPATYKDAENQLLELIKRDFNRASVIIWSVGNENADTDARLKFMGNLARVAKEYDPTRLVSAACLVNHQKIRIEDRLANHLDVIGLNEYYGWYSPNFEELVQLGQNSNPDKPVIITETGAGALAGHHGSKTDKFTEEYMERVYARQVEVIRTLDYIKGLAPWILYDFRASRRYNRFQKGWNRKGVIANDKQTKKLAFYVLQQFYKEKAAEEQQT